MNKKYRDALTVVRAMGESYTHPYNLRKIRALAEEIAPRIDRAPYEKYNRAVDKMPAEQFAKWAECSQHYYNITARFDRQFDGEGYLNFIIADNIGDNYQWSLCPKAIVEGRECELLTWDQIITLDFCPECGGHSWVEQYHAKSHTITLYCDSCGYAGEEWDAPNGRNEAAVRY